MATIVVTFLERYLDFSRALDLKGKLAKRFCIYTMNRVNDGPIQWPTKGNTDQFLNSIEKWRRSPLLLQSKSVRRGAARRGG